MSIEVLVHAADAAAVRAGVVAAGGRLVHALTPDLLVISLPDSVSVSSIPGASPADPGRLEGTERALAEAWLATFGVVSATAEWLSRAAAPPIAWDTPGYTPPDHLPGRSGPLPSDADRPRSTNTPTSVELTGSVAVGLLIVSGHSRTPASGALKYVSVGADGAVWRVNAGDQIFRRSGNEWVEQPGRLKQISVGNATTVWGVNADDRIFRWNGAAWDPVSGALKHVSAANDGSVWGANKNDEIFRWNGNGWEQVSGRLKQISVGNASGVWGVNADDMIFRWNGNDWDHIAGSLKHVSVAADGSVFGVNAGDEVFSYGTTDWIPLTRVFGRLKQISAASRSVVWGVNSSDQIFTNAPGPLEFTAAEKQVLMREVLAGLTFLASANPAARVSFVHEWRDVSVSVLPGTGDDYEDFEAPWRNAALELMGFLASRDGSEQFVQALRAKHRTDWSYVAYFTKYPLHHFAYADHERLVMHYDNASWGPAQINRVFAHETCHIFGAADEHGSCGCGGSGHGDVPNHNCLNCTDAQVPCLMNANTLSLCPWSRAQIGWSPWESIAGALRYTSVGSDGAVWGVNAGGEIFRLAGSVWHRISGALTQISVGGARRIAGVNHQHEIYSWNGYGWTQLSGALKHISVAADGTMWGVNQDDKIFRRNGARWDPVAGRLTQISVGHAAAVWGVNADDEIYRWNGTDWTQVAGALKHVSVAADGSVWGVNRQDKIFQRNGSRWNQVPGTLRQVSVGAAGVVVGVNASDQIYRLG